MATYNNKAFQNGPWDRDTSDSLVTPAETARTYANGDIVRGPRLWKQTKIANAHVAIDPIDTNATPTATGALTVFDGADAAIQDLITLTAAQMKAGGVYPLNVIAGLGYVVPSTTTGVYYVGFRITAAVATAASATVRMGLSVTALNFGGQDPSSGA